jgi:hypothetical protein
MADIKREFTQGGSYNELRVSGSKITLPKWLLAAMLVGTFAVGGTWAKLLMLDGRVGRLETAQQASEESLQRMEKDMCGNPR